MHAKSAIAIGLLSLCLFVHSATPCIGDIVFHFSPGAIQPNENVLFNGAGLIQHGSMVQGITNQHGTVVNASSNEMLMTPAHGQSRIEAEDGRFEMLDISLDDLMKFISDLEFNIRIPNNVNTTSTLVLTVEDRFGVLHQSSPFVLGNGSNFFAIEARNGMAMKQISISANSQIITQATHFRLTIVPEPAGGLFLAFVTLLAAYSYRRNARKFA